MGSRGEDTLNEVRAYLADRVLGLLPPEERSEFRAALKLLDEATREVAAGAGSGLDPAEAEARVLALQEQVRSGGDGMEELDALYEQLGEEARARSAFQSVFPYPDEGAP